MSNYTNSTPDYRFGFNGMLRDEDVRDEKLTSDNEGRGNNYDFGARILDPRTGRFLSLDPLMGSFPWQSPYVFAGNDPINFIDFEGKSMKGHNSNLLTGKDMIKNAGKIVMELANELYIQYKVFSPKTILLDKNGQQQPMKDLFGNPINETGVFKEAAINFIIQPLGTVGKVEKALINGLEKEIVSVSTTQYFKHGKNIKVWNKGVIESTKSGDALFKPDIDLKALDMEVFKTGTIVPNKNVIVKKMDYPIGATNGKETNFVKTYVDRDGAIHSVPINENDYRKLLKDIKNANQSK